MFAFHLKPESERLKFRELENEDQSRLFQIYGDKDAMKFRGSKSPQNLEDARQIISDRIIETGTAYKHRLALIHKPDNKLIGTVLIQQQKAKPLQIEIGYSIDKLYWNKGLATEVVQLLIQHFKRQNNIEALVAWCAKDNIASAKVLEKNGFKEISQNRYFGSRSFMLKIK